MSDTTSSAGTYKDPPADGSAYTYKSRMTRRYTGGDRSYTPPRRKMGVALLQKEDGTQRKSIYHSDLVRLNGPIIKLKSVIPSKFPKPGLSHCAIIELSDELDYSLAVEDNTLPTWMSAPKDRWIKCVATGDRDHPAGVHFADDAGPIMTQEPWPTPDGSQVMPDAHHAPPPKADPTDALWQATVLLVEGAYPNASDDAKLDAAARMFSTRFIQASR